MSNYIKIKKFDIANGDGVRLSIFLSGCEHKCPDCFSKSTWDKNAGKEFTLETMEDIIHELGNPNIKGLSILGGDPLAPYNILTTLSIVTSVKSILPDKDIWLWTGYDFYDIVTSGTSSLFVILKNIDVLIDGKFEQENYNMNLRFRGSSNQRVIDMPKTLQNHKIIHKECNYS